MGQGNRPPAPPPPGGGPGSIFVPLAPCRILNTLTDHGANPGQALRHVDIRSTRCGRIIPAYATGFVLKTVSYSKADEKLPPALARNEHQTALPAQANGFDFSIPADAEFAVDVYGYYVAPGTPVDAMSAAADPEGSVTASATSASRLGHPGALDVQSGNKGWIYLDASVSPFTSSGVLMTAPTTAAPWITAKLGTADAASGFAVFSSTGSTALFQARGDGNVKLGAGAFLDGRTDYYASSDSYYGFTTIPTNIVHDVTLVDPHDSAGGATNRVVFYNAQTDDEYSSPDITKFRAYTFGYYNTKHINFDSQINYHRDSNLLYHFRAFSPSDGAQGKDTFWVKPGTDGTVTSGTRADMYVSGYVGIGTTTPASKLQVENVANNTDVLVSAGDFPGTPSSPSMTLMRKDGNQAPLAKYGFKLDATDGNKFKIQYGTTGAFTSTPLAIDTGGNVTLSGNVSVGGVIYAKYQDVAEWVPAGGALPSGTVVILNREKSNEVTPSTTAYDTAVAGVVSDQPGLLLGTAGTDKAKIATTGRVKVRVDARTHPVNIGDLLVTSDVPGTAMLSEPLDLGGVKIHRPGTLIGKALEPLPSGEGEILVLLSLQ